MGRRRSPRLPEQAIEVTIEDLSHDGRGIARVNGKTVFVTGALPGETVMAQLTQRKRNYDQAKTVEVITASDLRVEARCPHFEICGGCALQHMDWASQISFKQNLLKTQLHHFGGVAPEAWLEPMQANAWGYRRKARLGVKHVIKKGGILVGFREKQSSFIADIKECHVLHENIAKLLLPLRESISQLNVCARLPQIEVAMGDKTIALVFRHLDPLIETDCQKLIDFGKNHEVEIYLQPKGPETVHKIWPLQGEDRLYYQLAGFNLQLAFHPMDFTQVNTEINRKMTTLAVDMLDPQPDDKVLDLFCGLGNFSLPLAKRAGQVIAVEGVETMVERGYENAKRNHLENIDFYAADLMIDFSQNSWASEGFDKILIDPPRSGAQEVCEYISVFNAHRIVYVSCNPATLARDAGILIEKGYKLIKAGVMDMFPHTGHVESIALFEK